MNYEKRIDRHRPRRRDISRRDNVVAAHLAMRPRKTDCRGSDGEEASGLALLDVAHATGLSTDYEIRFAESKAQAKSLKNITRPKD